MLLFKDDINKVSVHFLPENSDFSTSNEHDNNNV